MSEIFTQTSDKPYLKHTYKLVFKNKKYQIFDNYKDLLETWYYSNKEDLDFVEVLDYKEKVKSKGFK